MHVILTEHTEIVTLIAFKPLNELLRVHGSVTNNNSFWIGFIGTSVTINLNHNHL
jgi:hypothetical protein